MILAVPDFRQDYDYDCGAAATRSVAAFFEVGAGTEDEYIEALRTDVDGTNVERIISLLSSFALKVSAAGMTLEELRKALGPVICAVQYRGYGHYVVVTGLESGVIHLQDPGAGLVHMPIAAFERIWTDDGYTRLGIAVRA